MRGRKKGPRKEHSSVYIREEAYNLAKSHNVNLSELLSDTLVALYSSRTKRKLLEVRLEIEKTEKTLTALRLEESGIVRQLRTEMQLVRVEKANRLSGAWYLRSIVDGRVDTWLGAYRSKWSHDAGLQEVKRILLGGFGIRLNNQGADQLVSLMKTGSLSGKAPLEMFEKLSPEFADEKLKEAAKADVLAELESQERLEEAIVDESA